MPFIHLRIHLRRPAPMVWLLP